MSDLTNEQKTAISHSKGPACVIAGAGTGKTRTLTERIFWLIEEQHLDPNRILVTTFTRKATAELYNRAYERLGESAQKLRISTIDALIGDLAQWASQRGFMRSARLIGEAEQRLLLMQGAWETFGHKETYSKTWWTENPGIPRIVDLLQKCLRAELAEGQERQTITHSIRSDLRQMRISPYLGFYSRVPTLQDLKRGAEKYRQRLKELGATDYDLLSRDFLACLKTQKKLAAKFAAQFASILVDEFQDTSRIQAEVLLLLSGKQRNIWVVGDPCQQIYEWRGAGPENLLWFIKQTRAKKYHLTENWRSSQPILDCAYRFLSRRVPSLRKNGMLKPLKSMRDKESLFPLENNQAVFLGNLDQALWFVRHLLESRSNVRPYVSPFLKSSHVAILSRELSKRTREEIERKAHANGLEVQFHSSRADHAADETVGDPPPNWKAGTALENLYGHPLSANMDETLTRLEFSVE